MSAAAGASPEVTRNDARRRFEALAPEEQALIQERWQRYQALPEEERRDGQRFLVFALGAADVRGVYLGSLAACASRKKNRAAAPFCPRSVKRNLAKRKSPAHKSK